MTANPQYTLKVCEISKIYGQKRNQVIALNKVSFAIQKGEMLAITGSSGSGKSTLMNILGCMDKPDHGQYYLDGQELSTLKKDQLSNIRNRKIGFIFQSFNLLPRITALQNVFLPLLYRSEKLPMTEMAWQALQKVGLEQRADHMPNELSGGEKQRVAIARALVTKPNIILADEPTGNLDSKTGDTILSLFNELHAAGQTVIIITHDLEIATRCPRQIKLSDGQIIADAGL